jgi:hypothetical protein
MGMIFGEQRDATLDRCYRGGKLHNFESRHDITEVLPTLSDTQMRILSDNAFYNELGDALEQLKTENSIYVHDICVWCGEIRKRS